MTKIIRINFPGDAPQAFEDDLVRAIDCAITALSEQYFGRRLTEEETEICVGQLYDVKRRIRGGCELPGDQGNKRKEVA